jgi:hypothetical protein
MAEDIANDVVQFGDSVKNKIIKKNLSTAFEALTLQFSIKVKEVDSISDRINAMSDEDLIFFGIL